MSCRIDRVTEGGEVVLCISGRITAHDLDTVREVMKLEASVIAIDLENVDLVDRDVVRFLAERKLNGTALRNCAAYIREWVAREKSRGEQT